MIDDLEEKEVEFNIKMQKNYILDLLTYSRDVKSPSITQNYTAEDAFLKTEKELKRLNSIVRKKSITEEHLGNSIFNQLRGEVSNNQIETHVRDHFTAAYLSFIDIKERLIKDNCFDKIGIKKYGYIITLIIFDVTLFAEHIGKKQDPDYYFFKGYKSSIEHSKWHYLGTFQLLHNSIFDDKRLDDKFAYILSAVSLRQTLELKILRILGIGDYYDKNGNKIYASHNFFFDFVGGNLNHFNYGKINFKIIQKIFEFCNISVHKGIMPFFWQMHFALKFCDPLFYEPITEKGENWHFDGTIKINKYKDLQEKLKIALQKEVLKKGLNTPETTELEIHWIKPEAQIVSN